MKIGLINVDSKTPNLVLMKLSAWHKSLGDTVSWYDPLFCNYDRVYASKVFSFTPDYAYYPAGVIKGGTGYGQNYSEIDLDEQVEHMCPDYDLYRTDVSLGFLTRGCPNKCAWCIVPTKEGAIRPNADVTEFLRHDKCVLMDNNILAHTHGLNQIKKMAELKIKVDFNQGLDVRLIDSHIAKLLADLKWLHPLRLACDTDSQKKHIEKAVALLRFHGCKPSRFFCYMLIKDIDDAYDRSEFLRSLNIDAFAQPYRDFSSNSEPTEEQKKFARWVNRKAIWKSVKWKDYK